MGVKLQSALGGSVELNAPSTASNFTMTVPAGNGTVATTDQLTGFKNILINGGMQVQQRGAVVFSSSNNLYGWVDRWLVSISGTTVTALGYAVSIPNGNSIANGTVSGNALQIGNLTTTGTTGAGISQRIEAINSFGLNGKTVTFSGKVYNNSGATRTLAVGVSKPTAAGVDNWSTQASIATTTISVPVNVWTPFTHTVTLGATDASKGLSVVLNYGGMTAQSNAQYYFADCQLEVGSVATPFELRPHTIELALCQRYYYKRTFTVPCLPWAGTNNYTAGHMLEHPVTMRAIPSIGTTQTSTISTTINALPSGTTASQNATNITFISLADYVLVTNNESTGTLFGVTGAIAASAEIL